MVNVIKCCEHQIFVIKKRLKTIVLIVIYHITLIGPTELKEKEKWNELKIRIKKPSDFGGNKRHSS